jgi:hypothetical protein
MSALSLSRIFNNLSVSIYFDRRYFGKPNWPLFWGKKERILNLVKQKITFSATQLRTTWLHSTGTRKKNGGRWLLGKTMDGFCPIGPDILTADKVPDPHNLKISCSVNGHIKQTSNTNQLIHGVFDCISFLSNYVTLLTWCHQSHVNMLTTTRFCTLLPGDIILTGTLRIWWIC